jgi:L-galactose dehydrogenase
MSVPKRPSLRGDVSIVGLGCSSFSSFFDGGSITIETMLKSDLQVQKWIQTIHYAIHVAGITVLDTAPWYGHGTSEVVVGWALQDTPTERQTLTINTKVGRYDADPGQQFDYTRQTTIHSAKGSLKRLQCGYIDVLQLHDPEFAPSLSVLLDETIPAMICCKEQGICRAIGMTGYPLHVQHLIMQASLERFGRNVWDQALTYSHFNLHDTSLFSPLPDLSMSYPDYCIQHNIALLAAAPLSMGLLTQTGPPEWHPASAALRDACRRAACMCADRGVNVSTLALLFALSEPRLPCTILGMKDVEQVKIVQKIANRFQGLDGSSSQQEVLEKVLTTNELACLKALLDAKDGLFAGIQTSGDFEWDGVQEAKNFWKLAGRVVNWQTTTPLSISGGKGPDS